GAFQPKRRSYHADGSSRPLKLSLSTLNPSTKRCMVSSPESRGLGSAAAGELPALVDTSTSKSQSSAAKNQRSRSGSALPSFSVQRTTSHENPPIESRVFTGLPAI